MTRRPSLEPLVPLIGVAGLLALWYLAVKTRVIDPVLRHCDRHRKGGLEGPQRPASSAPTSSSRLQRTGLAIAFASAIGNSDRPHPRCIREALPRARIRGRLLPLDARDRDLPAVPAAVRRRRQDQGSTSQPSRPRSRSSQRRYGVMNARKTRLLAAWLMGARRHQILLVVLLESFPQTFIDCAAASRSRLIVVIVAEMFIGSKDGLGNSIFEAQQLFEMPAMYAAIFASGALGYGLNLLFRLVERRVVHWAGK